MFTPKKLPKKKHKIGIKKIQKTGLVIYNFGVLCTSYSFVTHRQLEAFRRYLNRRVGKRYKKLVRIKLNRIMYKKASKARMGKGKGKFYKWYGYICPGKVIFEFNFLFESTEKIYEEFYKISSKLPFKCKLIKKDFYIKKEYVF